MSESSSGLLTARGPLQVAGPARTLESRTETRTLLRQTPAERKGFAPGMALRAGALAGERHAARAPAEAMSSAAWHIVPRSDALNAAQRLGELHAPGFDFHRLKGHRAARYSLHVNGPWRITFDWVDGDALRAGLEQCHQETNMTEHTAKRHAGRPPAHPGAILREDVSPALGLTVTEAARRLRVSRRTLHDLLAERKGFAPGMALRAGALAGNGAAFWLRMQQDHELWHAGRRLARELREIGRAAA